eukprot:6106088-Pyramimonas_sp.AAC.1
MPGGLQFYAQTQPRLRQARVSKVNFAKMAVNCSKVIGSVCGPCFVPAILLRVLFVTFPPSIFPNLSRGAETAASSVEDVSGAGGAVAFAAMNLTMAVSGVALSVARNSATFVDEA